MQPPFTKEQADLLRARSRALVAAHPPAPPIDADAIAQALDPDSAYFITTSLWWECECPELKVHPRYRLMCEDCGAFKEDCPDARISGLRSQGIHIVWDDPEILVTLDQYNTAARRPSAAR